MERDTLPVIGVILRANSSIGTGHLMRIRSLLPKIKSKAYLRLYVYAFDKALLPMCNDYDEVLEFKCKEDIFSYLAESYTGASAATIHPDYLIGKSDIGNLPKVVIIDDYAIDSSLESLLYEHCKIFVVDDLYDRPHQCHMLLDQTLITHESEYQKLCNSDCELLLGSQYSLTQERFYPEFYDLNYQSPCTCGAHQLQLNYRALLGKDASSISSLAKHCSCSDGQALPFERIFISFGGADPVSACLHLTDTIIKSKLYEQYCFTLLAGAANKDYDTIVERVRVGIPKQYQQHFILLHHCSDVADLLFKHDAAIGAYGGMFRERIASAIPTAGVMIADNQKGADVVVEQNDIGLTLSLDELNDIRAVSKALKKLSSRSQEFTNNCLKIYDGKGLKRIEEKVLSLLNA